MHYEVLANGTEMLVGEDQRVACAALQVWVKVGALCERQEQHGMAHFVEHMLFKGTKTSKVGELSQKVESWGGDINAYTDYDRTVYHMTLNANYTLDGLAALYDAIYHSEFSASEIAREKEVVCEEINYYRDDPSDRIHEEARKLAFDGQVHPILGDSVEAVRAFSRADLLSFYDTHYVPRNISVIAVGAFAPNVVCAKITELFAAVPDKPVPPSATTTIPFATGERCSVLRGDYHVPRLLLVLPAPCQHDVDTFALDCAAYVLGSGDASRFNMQLRDKQRLASAISCTNMASSRWGMLEIAALGELDNIPALLTSIRHELHQLLDTQLLSATELQRAKANSKVDFVVNNETALGRADSLAYGLTTPWKYLFNQCYLSLLEKISPALVQQALARWLNLEQAVVVCAVKENAAINTEALIDSWQRGQVAAHKKTTTHTSRPQSAARQVVQLRAGVQLIHQPSESELFNLSAVTHGGVALENGSNNGIHNAMAALLGQATAAYDYPQLIRTVEEHGATLAGFCDTNSIGMQLQCLQQDAQRFTKILASCLLQPRFPPARWQTLATEIADSIALQAEDPATFCMHKYRATMFADHPYGMSLLGTDPQQFDTDMLLQQWHRARQRGAWVIAISSALTTDEIQAMVAKALADFNPPAHAPAVPQLPALHSNRAQRYPKPREQCHIVYGLRGLAWQDSQRAVLDVLLKIKAQRMFVALREQQGLVYTVTPVLTLAVGAGTFGIYTACTPAKAKQAIAAIADELRQGTPPTVEEITRAQQYLAGNWYTEMSRGEQQVIHLARMQLFGVGHDNIDAYPQKLLQVSAEDINALGTRLLHEQPHVCIEVG